MCVIMQHIIIMQITLLLILSYKENIYFLKVKCGLYYFKVIFLQIAINIGAS